MARNIRLTPYDEQIGYDHPVQSLDEPTSGPEFLAYGSTPSMAKRDYFLPEDIPLFLANDADELQPPRFGSGGDRHHELAPRRSQFIKAGFLVVSAAIAAAILTVDNPLALFANAKASLIGVQANASPQSPPDPVTAAPSAVVQPAPAMAPPTVSLAALPASPPTRDEIALALKAAHQVQPEIRQPVAAAPATPQPRLLDADELATLMKRAKNLIAIGDIAAARLLLERAADAQESSAALLLAQTYDPAVLGTPDARSITPDPAKARDWYQKAARFGSKDAQQRLTQIQN